MKILFLSELFYPHGGGAELAAYLYARIASKEGQNVTIVTNRFSGELEISHQKNMTIQRIPLFGQQGVTKYSMWHRFDFVLSSRFRTLLRNADIVYVPRFWYPVVPFAKSLGKKVVVHLHDYIPMCPLTTVYDQTRGTICSRGYRCSPRCIYLFEKMGNRNRIQILGSMLLNLSLGRCLGRLIGLSDAIICVSRAQRNLIVRNSPYLEKKTVVINNPLPDVPYSSKVGDDFGYFGGPSRLKGFSILCKAVKSINDDYQKVATVHATKFDTSEDSFYKSRHGSKICPYGKIGKEELDRINEKVRAVIVPSIWPEPAPYVVVEALARGKMVIASEIGGIPELLAGSHGCFLFPPGDYRRLAEDMLYVAALDKRSIVSQGAENRERILKRFSDEKIATEFTKLLSAIDAD